MKFLSHLINAFKLTNLTYPYKNALTYASVAVGGDKGTQKRSFASKTSGGKLNGDEGFQEAFAILSLLRDNSLQVELLTENLEELKADGKKDEDEQNSTMNSLITAVDIKGSEQNISSKMKKGISLEKTNSKKTLISPSNVLNSGYLNDSILSLSTNNRLLPYDTTTISLHLNTLINGIVHSDPKRDLQFQLQSVKVPEFNEYLTSLAANLCSAAFQSGISNESYRKYYSTEYTQDIKSIQKQGDKKIDQHKKIDSASDEIVEDLLKKYNEFQNEMNVLAASSTVAGKETKNSNRDPHIVCVGDEKKGCISPGNAENPPYIPKKSTQLDKPQETKGVLNGLRLLDPKLYKKSLKEAEKRRKELAKASASCKEKLSMKACQSKKSKIKDPCKPVASKCAPEVESVKNSESKTNESKCFSEKLVSRNPNPKCESDRKAAKLTPETKDPCKMTQSSNQEDSSQSYKCNSQKKSTQKDPCEILPKTYYKSKNVKAKCSPEPKTDCGSKMTLKLEDSSKIQQNKSKCVATESPLELKTPRKTSSKSGTMSMKSQIVEGTSKCSSKPEPNAKTTLNLSGKSESKLDDPCKVPQAKTRTSSDGLLSSRIEDPRNVPSITFNKSLEKSTSDSKCSPPSKPKCEENPSPCAKKSASASKCSSTTNSEKPPETNASKCSSKCSSSNSCVKTEKEPIDADSDKACKRVSMDVKKSCVGSEPKNPCKSPCDSINKPKSKCGRPPRGDTRPRCKKDSNCVSKKISPCASKEKLEPKCGTDVNPPPPAEPSKCKSKTCAPSPKTSETKLKSKSTCTQTDVHTKSKTTAPSSEPQKRKLHSLSNFSFSNLIFRRNFSDDCPQKPKSGYKLETKRSDEYRRETCENFSWKASKLRKKRTNQPKNCYPDETLEFCPDTACYKVYAETSRKSNKKRSKKDPKANKMEKIDALCIRRNLVGNFGQHHKRYFSSKPVQSEEALIQKPHSVCTRKLILPKISDNDALVCVDSVALSDTDIHMFETGGRHVPELTLGNEAAGVVAEVGRSICDLKLGDHVVLESGIPCFKCDLCKMGHYNICNNISFRGFLKNQCIHPASFCHKICPSTPLDQAALVPQLAVGCNACYQACIKPNSNVTIIGSCAKTVCAAMCAISMGAENVCVICGMPETRILIEQFVTQKVDCFDSNTIEKGIVRTILATLGTFPDIIINFAACTKTMNATVMALKPAGVCVVAGFLSECVSYNIMDALMKEIRIIPSFRSKNMFPRAIHLLESDRAPLDCLIANCELCKWNELEGAFKLALSEGNNGPRKSIVKCQLRD